MIRRCPQCGTTSDDVYGFCIRCGYEFPKIPESENACPLCGYPNPDEADFCVKCGTPLIFKSQFEDANNNIQPIVIKKEVVGQNQTKVSRTSSLVIILGYFFSILGSIIGLIFALYLITRKDPRAKKHGYIQIAIIVLYIIVVALLFATGNIPPEIINEYQRLLAGNFTPL